MESSGFSFHFFSSWQECHRKFYFARVARLDPGPKGSTRIGLALHEALAAHRSGKDARKALWDYFELEFDDPDERREGYTKASFWLNSWLTRFEPREQGFRVQPELELKMPLDLSGDKAIELSGRLDALIHDEELTIEDLKSSSYKGEDRIVADEMASDQYAMYAALTRYAYGVNPRIRINVAYLKPALPQAGMSDPFWVSLRAQQDYLDGIRTVYFEIEETLQAFDAGVKLESCFPRSTAFCCAFGCPYQDICRGAPDIRDPQPSPAGFGISDDTRALKIYSHIGRFQWENTEHGGSD